MTPKQFKRKMWALLDLMAWATVSALAFYACLEFEREYGTGMLVASFFAVPLNYILIRLTTRL